MSVDQNFADVTLAYEDSNEIEAHKVILSVSSPFFKLLKNNNHTHPLIYMKVLYGHDLMSLLGFSIQSPLTFPCDECDK